MDGGYIRQGKVKTEGEMNIFDHAVRSYQEFMLRVLKIAQKDLLLPLGKHISLALLDNPLSRD